jgi:pimeloyl-ACP methyl ester carboxylesterase
VAGKGKCWHLVSVDFLLTRDALQPRDAWNYANLMLNARSVVATNFPQWGISNDSVLILAPVFMDMADITAGAGRKTEIAFGGELWQKGSASQNPVLADSITSYEVMDFFADMLFNKTYYPNLNQVVIVGHSLGGQASMRYALLKRTKYYDNNMRFWVGNPGSWTWLSAERPYPNANASCPVGSSTSYQDWPYGLTGNISQVTKYARNNVQNDTDHVVQRYLGRSVHYALALLDNGPGDTRCQAQWQGANHLDRGSNFILAYENLTLGANKFPSAHTLDYIADTAHQDYPMYSANISLQRIFNDGFNTRNPDLVNVTDPGDVTHTHNASLPTTRPYATPVHEKVAVALLLGPLSLLIIVFAILPFIFSENFDDTWEKELKAASAAGHYPHDGTVSSMTHLLKR